MMLKLSAAVNSTVGRKFLMALTGLFWVLFLCGHLTGNILLIVGRDAFNSYAHFLTHSLFHGWAVWIADIILLVTLLAHAVLGWTIYLKQGKTRPKGYYMVGQGGGPSRKSLASQTMPFTGALILAFVVFHVSQFKFEFFGPGSVTYELRGEQVRDLYSVVIQAFHNVWVLAFYMVVMILIGFHLSHGFWSAFQSLGLNNSRFMPLIVGIGAVFAVVLALGFLVLPLLVAAGVVGGETVSAAGQGGLFL